MIQSFPKLKKCHFFICNKKNYNEITTFEELLEMYAYFFSHGAAAERFCNKDEVFEKLVKEAEKIPDHRVALGGNAPVMAKRFAMEGADVLLAAKMSDDFRINEWMLVISKQIRPTPLKNNFTKIHRE